MYRHILTLCFLTQKNNLDTNKYLALIEEVIEGGATSVQMREKSLSKTDALAFATELNHFLSPRHIPLIINDDVYLAQEIKASGVHLGQSDMCPEKARQVLGDEVIIGWSVESHDHLSKANQLTCIDYIGVGAIFSTQSKDNCQTYWGLDGLKSVSSQSKHPIIAIGGINKENAQSVIEHGATGVAVIGALHQTKQPRKYTKEMIQNIHQGETYV